MARAADAEAAAAVVFTWGSVTTAIAGRRTMGLRIIEFLGGVACLWKNAPGTGRTRALTPGVEIESDLGRRNPENATSRSAVPDESESHESLIRDRNSLCFQVGVRPVLH